MAFNITSEPLNRSEIDEVFQRFQCLEEAKEFATKDEKLRIWAEDKTSGFINTKDCQYFWVATVERFAADYLRTGIIHRFYEVIQECKPARLYLDIEFSKKEDIENGMDVETHVKLIVNEIIAILNNEYDMTTSFEDVVILDASDNKQFSYHVIFSDAVFCDNTECKDFVEKFCNENKNIVYLNEMCIINLSVYTKWQQFPLWKSYKLNQPLIISKLDKNFQSWEYFKTDENDKRTAPMCFFRSSLVTTYQYANMPIPKLVINKNLQKSEKKVFVEKHCVDSSPWLWIDMVVKHKVYPAKVKNVSVKSNGSILYNLKGKQHCHIALRQHHTHNTYVMVDSNHEKIIKQCYHQKCEGKEVILHILKPKTKKKKSETNTVLHVAKETSDEMHRPIIKKVFVLPWTI